MSGDDKAQPEDKPAPVTLVVQDTKQGQIVEDFGQSGASSAPGED